MAYSTRLRLGLPVLLVVVLPALAPACRPEPTTSLAELAAQSAPPEVASPATQLASPAPLMALQVVQPARFITPLRPLLPLLRELAGEELLRSLTFMEQLTAIYLELDRFDLALDEGRGEIALGGVELVVTATPSSPEAVAWLQELLGKMPRQPETVPARCRVAEERILCGTAGMAEERLERVATLLSDSAGAAAAIRLSVSLPALVREAERLATATLFWAVVPEELGRFERLELLVDREHDLVTLELVAGESAVLANLELLAGPPGSRLEYPPAVPAAASGRLSRVGDRLEGLEKSWSDKLTPPRAWQLTTFLNERWQNQMVELADGELGILLVDGLNLGKLGKGSLTELDGLVFFIQVAEPERMEERLAHVFGARHFEIEDGTLAGGEPFRAAVWKQRKGKDRERLAWYRDGNTWYFGDRDRLQRLRDLQAAPTAADALPTAPAPLIRFQLLPGKLIEGMLPPEGAGLSGGMALAMVKSSFAGWESPIRAAVRLGAGPGAGERSLRLEVEGLWRSLDGILGRLEGLLKLVPATT